MSLPWKIEGGGDKLRINGTDISLYGAKQHTVEMGYGEIKNNSEWVDGCNTPIMLSGTTGFKKIKVTVILKGDTREQIWKNGSQLIAQLLNPAVVELDGFSHKFCVYLKNVSQAERDIQKWHKATLELIGYEFGNQMTITVPAEKTVFEVINEGTIETAAILELTPAIGKVSMTISGVVRNPFTGEDKPVTIQNLKKDVPIVIDGENGFVTEGGINKFADVDLFDFPSLLPGRNKIVTDQKDVAVVVKYKPRYI